MAPEVGGIEGEGQRAFEHLGDLMGVGVYFDRRRDHADDRRHQEPGHGGMVLDLAEDAHPVRRDAGLLLQLTQRRRPRVLIIRLDAPAGEADLPGVIGKMVGAPGQQHRDAAGAHDQGHQHGGRDQRLVHLERQIVLFGADDRVRVHHRRQRIQRRGEPPGDDFGGQLHVSGVPSAKKCPSLHTP